MGKILHLDEKESVFFERELESKAIKNYEVKLPELKGRQLIPTESDVPEWAHSLSWRMFEQSGKAQFIGNNATDLPRVDAEGTEGHKVIRDLGASYGYTLSEIKAAATANRPLDQMRARAARRAVETLIDETLALGSSAHGLEGLLSLTGAGTYTPSTKEKDSGTTWGTIDTPNATGLEIGNDIRAIAKKAYIDSKGAFSRFTVVLPVELYETAAGTLLSLDNPNGLTALDWALKSPHVASVESWLRCDGVGSTGTGGGKTRMVCYPKDPEVVAGILPLDYMELDLQIEGFFYKRPVMARCGGVVSRYPSMVIYGDGI